MRLITIEKTFFNLDSIRYAREAQLIKKGRTTDLDFRRSLADHRLNISEQIVSFYYVIISLFYFTICVVPVSCLQILLVGSLVTISSRKRDLFARYSLSFQENKEVQIDEELRRVQENLAVDSASQKPWKFRSV